MRFLEIRRIRVQNSSSAVLLRIGIEYSKLLRIVLPFWWCLVIARPLAYLGYLCPVQTSGGGGVNSRRTIQNKRHRWMVGLELTYPLYSLFFSSLFVSSLFVTSLFVSVCSSPVCSSPVCSFPVCSSPVYFCLITTFAICWHRYSELNESTQFKIVKLWFQRNIAEQLLKYIRWQERWWGDVGPCHVGCHHWSSPGQSGNNRAGRLRFQSCCSSTHFHVRDHLPTRAPARTIEWVKLVSK